MKAFGALLFVALAAVASAGPALIPNHPTCAAINNDYYHSFPDPDDCTCYYVCDWANAVRFCCPADNESPGNLVFNPILEVCDRRNAAIESGAICTAVTEPITDPEPSPPTCHPPTPAPADGCEHRVAECPSGNEYYHSYSHATCDNKFCLCDWGKAIVRPCPADHAPKNFLVFNDVLQVCDYQKDGVDYNLCD